VRTVRRPQPHAVVKIAVGNDFSELGGHSTSVEKLREITR
jgi:hypothetical protein